ncbi:MAG: hypothetical protein ACM3JK_03825 [Betaproteobacteria bacterium]
MRKPYALTLLAGLALPGLADEAPQGVVQLFDCGGRQILLVVPAGSEAAIPADPCALTQQREENRPSSFICVGGTCFPRSFIVTPAPAKPAPPKPMR